MAQHRFPGPGGCADRGAAIENTPTPTPAARWSTHGGRTGSRRPPPYPLIPHDPCPSLTPLDFCAAKKVGGGVGGDTASPPKAKKAKVHYDPLPTCPTVQLDGWTLHPPTLIYK